MRRHLQLFSALLLFAFGSGARAVENPRSQAPHGDRLGPWVPDFVKLQSGGFSGVVAVGAGYAAFGDKINVSLLYGYVPPKLGGDVHSLHLTFVVRPLSVSSRHVRWLPAYAGAGALCTWGEGYFLTLPQRYRSGYYSPTACHATFHVGAELEWLPGHCWVRAHGLYAELTTVDTLVIDYFQNPRLTAPIDVVSTALGYRLSF